MAQRPKSKHNKTISDPPGIARYLCEPCLRGSGWARIYESSPYLGFDSTSRICGNCDRPETVTRIRVPFKDKKNSTDASRIDASYLKQFAEKNGTAELLKELESEWGLSGTETQH